MGTLPDHKSVPWGWGLQPLAAQGETGTTLRPGRGVGGLGKPGTPLSALDAEMPG